MKKILISVMSLALVVGLLGAGAMAYFSDVETSEGNTFTAGTLDLAMDDQNPCVSAIFTFPDIRPCEDLDPIVIKLKNVGQNNGYLYQKIDYVEKDKPEDELSSFEFSAENDPSMEMTANGFAALIYVKSIVYQHVYSGGGLGSQRDDLPDMLAVMDANSDGKCSLYELMLFGWMPYDILGETDPDPEHTLKAGEAGTWTIVFHMGDSLEGWALNGAILTDVEDNRPQADGIELTWTAILMQNPSFATLP